MEIPPSLDFSIYEIEKFIGKSIEALIVPYDDLEKSRDKKVKGTFWSSEKDPLVTINVADCNALVFFREGKFGLFHEYSRVDPEDYLPAFLERVKYHSKDSLSDFKAIQIAGDEDTYKKINDILSKNNIPVINEYRDKWNVGLKCSRDYTRRPKSVFVFPEKRKVLMLKAKNSHLVEVIPLYGESSQITLGLEDSLEL